MQAIKESLSVFDIFKIGIGPSSSHTLGPWRAGLAFLQKAKNENKLEDITEIAVYLYGSLAKTGKGHGTDIAVLMGLSGADPETFEVDKIDPTIADIKTTNQLLLDGDHHIVFHYNDNMLFMMDESLPYHPNAMTIMAKSNDGMHWSETYYSIGGGFIEQERKSDIKKQKISLPFPIENGADLLHWCLKTGLSISEVVFENETAFRSEEDTVNGIFRIWTTMKECVYRGIHTGGILPGGLEVQRRAYIINKKLTMGHTYHDFDSWIEVVRKTNKGFSTTLDWVSCFALAVNEENAAFGRVVTAPTNGAAGVIPAVLFYYIVFENGYSKEKIIQFLSVASEIGSIFKKRATISAAMGGCQAEIGVSSAMAAAALTECMGGTVRQCMMAAEIAMEHHLGLTCDPVAGLVQVPCIERNTMGAIKAITACQLALQSNPNNAKVSLDAVVKTMWETALDMNNKYKETADGGLAVNIPLGLSEC